HLRGGRKQRGDTGTDMADLSATWERELLEQFSCLTAATDEEPHLNTADITSESSDNTTGLLHLSDEVLLVILRNLDPVSLLRLGSTCSLLFRVCSCNFLWTTHFQDSFGVSLTYTHARCPVTAKTAFRLVFMWRSLFRNIHCNRAFQEKLFVEIPLAPHKYWIQWLVLEESVPLPSVRLPCSDVEKLWGITADLFQDKLHEKTEDCDNLKFEWRELYHLALKHHGSVSLVFQHVLRQHQNSGIQTVGNYFSMCKSLVAWILGRDWGRLKRRKVYEDTLEGVYLLLRREMQETLIEHERFWQVAKVQMTRVCTLEETAANYVNWKMIESLPYYKLYLVSGNSVYLDHVQGFLRRKRLIWDWIYLEENGWARQLLPESLYTLLEFDTKISQESLHGDCVTAQLSRLMWLYLNSGQELFLQALKGMVLQCAQACLSHLNTLQA
ncbi:uncharacterized protein LOC107678821, partial [Sinocyclocheilus anshuiensis]|uniref:uncharacterized protein LOC107678821 n=1 Tax=Sinocyclocheilus anshuiensis TaxID=1608454 RepID=UPI0007B8C421